ncbi:hypothetical protein [Myxococcus sp. Y35]|uniref:hypothetical protein n=1 Tax=Pseudomyxococcus flavus TaxID=3115648 RepID=UPI003CEC6DEE
MNLSMLSRGAAALLVVAALSLTTAGCAGRRREAFLLEKARNHVYRKPVAEVYPQALALLKEKGYSFKAGQSGYEATTEWLMQGAPSSLGTTQVRYLVRGIEKGPGQCSVEFTRQLVTESAGAANTSGRAREVTEPAVRADGGNITRDEQLEWELVQRVDAESAAALQAEAAKIQ